MKWELFRISFSFKWGEKSAEKLEEYDYYNKQAPFFTQLLTTLKCPYYCPLIDASLYVIKHSLIQNVKDYSLLTRISDVESLLRIQ